jgi:arylsulfatase
MKEIKMKHGLSVLTAAAAALMCTSCATAQPAGGAAAGGKKPNILFIMGDDIGMWNIGAYHRGMMAGRTPALDKMAKEGMLFTDYYAEASCTAGRANFIMGELPIRTGMTTVGQAGAKIGIPAEACTRTISAIAMNSCPPSTASTSSSVTSITSMRWKTRRIPIIRRTC